MAEDEVYVPKKRQQFAWVKDKAGNEYVCPVDSLKQAKDLSDEDLKNCVEDASVHQPGPGG